MGTSISRAWKGGELSHDGGKAVPGASGLERRVMCPVGCPRCVSVRGGTRGIASLPVRRVEGEQGEGSAASSLALAALRCVSRGGPALHLSVLVAPSSIWEEDVPRSVAPEKLRQRAV